MAGLRKVVAAAVCGLLAAATAGCGTSRSYPFDRETVWRAAVGEVVVWRPERIDEEKHTVRARRIDLAGGEILYDLSVSHDLNVFARRPSTRVHVHIRQTKPRRRSFSDLEKQFLMRIQSRLQAMTGAPSP